MPGYDVRAANAGTVLRAAAALERQQTFTRAQVAYLMALAYDAGRTATYREDLAELHSTWEDRTEPRRTYQQRVAERLDQMADAAARVAARLGRPAGYDYRGGPVDWDTGQPARHLEAAA